MDCRSQYLFPLSFQVIQRASQMRLCIANLAKPAFNGFRDTRLLLQRWERECHSRKPTRAKMLDSYTSR